MTVGTREERSTMVQPRTSCAIEAPMFLVDDHYYLGGIRL